MSTKNISNSEQRLANEIVASWKKSRSNIIVIAPPLTRARVLFSRISDSGFVESVLGTQARTLRICRLGTLDFKSDSTFVDAAIKGWGIELTAALLKCDPVERMEEAIRLLGRKGFSAVLLIDRFHEALTKLGEDIGTCLRNLEHDFGLRTVVELPVSLQTLRDRWEATHADSAPFLASDWGQGHLVKVLHGYSRDEIHGICGLSQSESDKAIARYFFDATSGLPELVDGIFADISGKPLKAIQQILRARSSYSCKRLLGWLDKPGDSLFKNLFVAGQVDLNVSARGVVLTDHDWKDFFGASENGVRPLMLSWAAADDLLSHRDVSFEKWLLNIFKNSDYVALNSISRVLSGGERAESRSVVFAYLVRFGVASDPFNPDWAGLDVVLKGLAINIDQYAGAEKIQELKELFHWQNLISLMLKYEEVKRGSVGLRLEEFLVRDGEKYKLTISAYAQLLELRLASARKLGGYLSVKSIIEQPESILQIYAYAKYGINFCSYEGDDESVGVSISKMFKKPFVLPKKGSRLGFIELLYLCLYKKGSADTSGALIESVAAASEFERLYELRKQQVHSTAFIENSDVLAYQAWCLKWIDGLWSVCGGSESRRALANVDAIAERILL